MVDDTDADAAPELPKLASFIMKMITSSQSLLRYSSMVVSFIAMIFRASSLSLLASAVRI